MGISIKAMQAARLVVAVLLCTCAAARPGGTGLEQGSGVAVVPSVQDVLHSHKRSAVRIFQRLDHNSDGTVTKMEMARHNKLNGAAGVGSGMKTSTIAVQADENADGMVDKREYAAWFADRKLVLLKNQEDFSAADSNHDGKLTYEEYQKSPMAHEKVTSSNSLVGCPMDYNPGPADTFCEKKPATSFEIARDEFTRMDRNHDLAVSKSEFMLDRSSDDHAAADRDGDDAVDEEEYLVAPRHWHGYGLHRTRAEKKAEFKRADRNKDGKISRKEFERDLRKQRLIDTQPNDDAMVDTSRPDPWVIYHEPTIAQREPHFESLQIVRSHPRMEDRVDEPPVGAQKTKAAIDIASSSPAEDDEGDEGDDSTEGATGVMTEQQVFAL